MLSPRSASQTASVTCCVVALPPRSGVCRFGSPVTRSTARISLSAAAVSPKCSSIIAPVQNVATGLAMPLPVMSKAEPWIGSNMEGVLRSGLRFAVGAMPSEPASAAARSDRMSAWRLVATIVSSVWGLLTMRMVIASTSILSQVTSGNAFATSAAISSHITIPWRCALDLVTTVRSLRGRERATSKAIADDPCHTDARKHRDVRGDLLRQALVNAPADPGVFALGVLSDDDPIKLGPGYLPERARDAGEDAGGTHVGVLVERLADREPQAPQRDVVGNIGRADGTEIDRIEMAQPIGAVFRHHDAVLLVIIRSPVKMLNLELEAAVAFGANFESLETGSDHLRPDTISADGRDAMGAHDHSFRVGELER